MCNKPFLFPRDSSTVKAYADKRMIHQTTTALFRGFTFTTLELSLEAGQDLCFVIGDPTLPVCPDNAEYALFADGNGVAVTARDYPSLMRGYAALLMKIECQPLGSEALGIAPCNETSQYKLANRMVHFCVFPETDISMLRRHLRLCGVLGYTHAVLEFWGTLPFNCCPTLAWAEDSYSREDVKDLIREVRELGMEPIPMFNHLGHAPASRVSGGKHVVLDQDPTLHALFTPDGWSWNTFNPNARKLLAHVRAELYELFGEGQYFHAGLDESYSYDPPHMFDALPEYLGSLTHAIAAEGRRPMIWMDMLLPPEAFGKEKGLECANKTPEKCREVLSALHPSTVLVDWQYDMTEAPIVTSLYLKDSGFDIMGAPWLNPKNGCAHIDTAVEHDLFGVMLTTWHTLSSETARILRFAHYFGSAKSPWSLLGAPSGATETATLLRKVSFEPLTYEQCGWKTRQIVTDAARTNG